MNAKDNRADGPKGWNVSKQKTTNEASEHETPEDKSAPCSSHCYPPVLDACCGSKMFWFDKSDDRVLFHDKRSETYEIKPDRAYPKGTTIEIAPDVQGDFAAMAFPSETFWLVVFDPPHIERQQELGIFTKKYGCLNGDWRGMLRDGFRECFRVLKPGGTLIFKWAESEHSVSEILKLTPEKPLFGHRTRQHSKTHWIAFLKPPCSG